MGSAAWPVSILRLSKHLPHCVKVCLVRMLLPLLQICQGLCLLCLLPLRSLPHLWSRTGFWMTGRCNLLTHCRLYPGRARPRWLALLVRSWETAIQKRRMDISLEITDAYPRRAGVLSAASNGATILRISADGESCGAANCTVAQCVAHYWLAIATALHVRHAQRGPKMLKVMMPPWEEIGFGDLPSTGL